MFNRSKQATVALFALVLPVIALSASPSASASASLTGQIVSPQSPALNFVPPAPLVPAPSAALTLNDLAQAQAQALKKGAESKVALPQAITNSPAQSAIPALLTQPLTQSLTQPTGTPPIPLASNLDAKLDSKPSSAKAPPVKLALAAIIGFAGKEKVEFTFGDSSIGLSVGDAISGWTVEQIQSGRVVMRRASPMPNKSRRRQSPTPDTRILVIGGVL